MVWFIVGMLVLVAGGAAVLFLVFHMTEDHSEPAPFAPDGDSPLGSTSEHAGDQAESAASEEDRDAHAPPDAPGAPNADVLPVGRYQSGPSGS